MTALTITVHGLPAPQGSKRHVGRGILVESSKAVGPWREGVRTETQRTLTAANLPTITGPVRVTITVRLPRPKGHHGARGLRPTAPPWPAGRPDVDKLARAILDGITAGAAIRDDAQVIELHATKVYADDQPPGATITVDNLEHAP